MGKNDGNILRSEKIIDNGPATSRFNIVLLSEGFIDNEIIEFQAYAKIFIDKLFSTSPFSKMRPATNVYRVDITSRDSGPDDPVSCGGSGKKSSTYFDSSFQSQTLRRLLSVNYQSVQNVVSEIVPQWHQILVIVKSFDWGGASGSVATTTVGDGWVNMAIHDLKQSAFGLIDESPSWDGLTLDSDKDINVVADTMFQDDSNSGLGVSSITDTHFPITQTVPRQGRSKFYKTLFFQHLRVSHDFWKG